MQNCQVDTSLLKEIPDKEITIWPSFLRKKPTTAIEKCNNSLTPGSDKLSWRYIKKIIEDNECINKLINIANACIDLGY